MILKPAMVDKGTQAGTFNARIEPTIVLENFSELDAITKTVIRNGKRNAERTKLISGGNQQVYTDMDYPRNPNDDV